MSDTFAFTGGRELFRDRTVLITGGTGSFGRKFSEIVLRHFEPKKLIVFSRDEFKQSEMAKAFPQDKYPIRYFLGDVRDRERLNRAFDGVDWVVHAAALKQVPALEYNPFEAVKTNIIGAENIVDAAIDQGVEKVVALSTDKAVNPVNLYGATKLTMEKIFVAANAYSGERKARFSMVRYGNVMSSRGSVIPLFMELLRQGARELPLTDERMTRFWITLPESVALVCTALRESVGSEIFVPRIPSMKVKDLVRALAPDVSLKVVGIRPGEKIHETLISEDESRNTILLDGYFVILPQSDIVESESLGKYRNCKPAGEGFVYRSDRNDSWLSVEELQERVKDLGGA